ncbi:fungal specific transcription factor domain-containing protein [Penicillium angulare]|uniref:fungal specific transcription factor domain-containing protein n=1 Tax=Penicillium angulare TaxID=116970 RepID=UPI00254008DE|nr:fungal specific transcription factor domain-containing protein [Penicillium angulare]KAJ5263363.1 fungal specific transcription factor domain-containing protein [Penicillium angulare]
MSGQRQETRSRWGRKRRKKCDETRPACKLCTERGVQCVFPDWTIVKYSRTRSRNSQTKESQPSPAGQPAILPAEPKSTETKFIHHFNTIVSGLITFTFPQLDTNPFVLHVLPRTSKSPQVQRAVEAVAAAHLYHLGAESRERATQLHSHALGLLAAELSSPQLDESSRINVLAGSLLLIYYEIVLGNSAENAWCHLQGARVLLEYNQQSPEPSCFPFFRKVFQYFNVMLALSLERRPLLIAGHEGPEFTDKMDTVFGCTGRLWPLMHRLADILGRAHLGEDVRRESQQLMDSLQAWSIESSPDPDAYLEAMVQIAHAYKYCGILMLRVAIPRDDNEIRYGYVRSQDQEIYRLAFDSVLRVCVLSTPMATLTWPLYVVGRLATSASDRTLILHIFSQFKEKHHMMVVDGAKNAVQSHWNEGLSQWSHSCNPAPVLLG